MLSKFYIISLGPGDPELITIKALKALQDCDVIFIPTRSKNNEWDGSVAYNILKKITSIHNAYFNTDSSDIEAKFKPVYTPMNYNPESWQDQVNTIAKACDLYSNVGYVTLGDAGLYSSAYYLLEIVSKNHNNILEKTEIIPGITSISSCSALVKKPLCLGNTSLEIIPMHGEDIKTTKVYMRLHKGDDVSHLNSENIYYFENLGLDNEAYGEGTPDIINNYLTVMIDFADYNEPATIEAKTK